MKQNKQKTRPVARRVYHEDHGASPEELRSIARLRLIGRPDDGPILLSLIEDLLAVCGDIEGIHAGEEILHLPLLEIEASHVDTLIVAAEK